MITLDVGTVVGKGRASTKVAETRDYWSIAHSMALEPIKNALVWWEDPQRVLQDEPSILTNKPKGSNTFHINLKISNKPWLLADENGKGFKVFSVKTDRDNPSKDEVAPALRQLIDKVSSIKPSDRLGVSIIDVYKASKEARWKAYANYIGVDDDDAAEKDKWWALGAPNTNWAKASKEDKKDTDLLTTNPVFP